MSLIGSVRRKRERRNSNKSMVRQKDGETDERKKKEGKSRSKAQEKSYGVYLDDWEEKEEFN